MPRQSLRSESTEQIAFFQRVDWTLARDLSRMVWAVPNGGKRDPKTAARLKAEGVKAGVLDITVAIARPGWHGLFIEMKRAEGGRASEAQCAYLAGLRAGGYRAEVCEGAEAAWNVLCDYLGVSRLTGR